MSQPHQRLNYKLAKAEELICVFYFLLSAAATAAVVSKTEMNVQVRNPEIVFVADLTRADAPALVMTTQCELVMKSGAEGSQMTAVINDLKVFISFLVTLERCVFFYVKFILIGVVLVGGGMSLPGREEEAQRDHSAAAVSGVLPEHSVADVPTGHGGLHQCSHTEGNSSCMTASLHNLT